MGWRLNDSTVRVYLPPTARFIDRALVRDTRARATDWIVVAARSFCCCSAQTWWLDPVASSLMPTGFATNAMLSDPSSHGR